MSKSNPWSFTDVFGGTSTVHHDDYRLFVVEEHTSTTPAFDNVTKKTVPLVIDLAGPETDLHFADHGAKPCTLEWASGAMVVRGSEDFTHWVLWSIPGKDFVCVEPWTCPGNALNTGERLLVLAPGETRTLWVEMEALR